MQHLPVELYVYIHTHTHTHTHTYIYIYVRIYNICKIYINNIYNIYTYISKYIIDPIESMTPTESMTPLLFCVAKKKGK